LPSCPREFPSICLQSPFQTPCLLLHASNCHFHNYSTDLSHKLEPPFSSHTHLVQPPCKPFNPTPHSQISKASHAGVMERQPPWKQMAQLTHNLTSLISGLH
jgi:hypothetical protein